MAVLTILLLVCVFIFIISLILGALYSSDFFEYLKKYFPKKYASFIRKNLLFKLPDRMSIDVFAIYPFIFKIKGETNKKLRKYKLRLAVSIILLVCSLIAGLIIANFLFE
ncbi:MAG: hypothetical protein ABIE94_00730 [archaeon]